MSMVVEKHERERVEYAAILENIKQSLQHLDSQKQTCVDRLSCCSRELQAELKEFQKLMESEDTRDATEKLDSGGTNPAMEEPWQHCCYCHS
jgi:hypothetical protein